jgi:hypothetical protein
VKSGRRCLLNSWSASDRSGERTERLLSGVRDGIQARRVWANIALEEAARIGLASFLKGFYKRDRAAISHDGEVLSKPRTIGAKRSDGDGNEYHTQSLFDYLTVDELRAKRREYLAQIHSYKGNLALADKLIALCEAAGCATPQLAASALGTSVDEWLGRDAA